MTETTTARKNCFSIHRDAAVAELTLCRAAEFNTMTRAFWSELPSAIRALDASGEVRALVLASSGKHFTAGMDLSVFGGEALATDSARRRAHLREKALWLQDAFNGLERARFPIIAAIQGGCIGGGVDMVCACDIRYATRDAFFCIQEINLGMMADLGTLQRLPKLLPEGVVRELAYTGDRLSAEEAFRLGFVNRLFDSHAEMLVAARDCAAKMATKSPLAISGSKLAITFARDYPVNIALEMCANWQAGMLDEDDLRAQFAATHSRVPAKFTDLSPLPDKL